MAIMAGEAAIIIWGWATGSMAGMVIMGRAAIIIGAADMTGAAEAIICGATAMWPPWKAAAICKLDTGGIWETATGTGVTDAVACVTTWVAYLGILARLSSCNFE